MALFERVAARRNPAGRVFPNGMQNSRPRPSAPVHCRCGAPDDAACSRLELGLYFGEAVHIHLAASVRLWRYLSTRWAACRSGKGEVGRAAEEKATNPAFLMSLVMARRTQNVDTEEPPPVVPAPLICPLPEARALKRL